MPGQDAEVDALLAEMDGMFEASGIDTSIFSAHEVTVMRGTPTKAVAIPPRSHWPRMVNTLKRIAIPLRTKLGFKIHVRGGYRPPDYNHAVGGKPKSRHQWFDALDISPDPYTNDNRRALALQAATMYLTLPKDLRMGLGVYGKNVPNTVHIDTGWTRRKWGQAKHWIGKAQTSA